MYYFTEIACILIELWMIHIFLDSFFEKRPVAKSMPILLYSFIGIVLTCLSLIPSLVFGRIFFTIGSVLAVSLLLYKARILPGLISGLIFCAIFAATDIVSALAFQLFGIQTDALMSDRTFRIIYLMVCHTIMFGFILLMCLINHHTKRSISLKILLPVTPCWLISLLLCFVLTWQCLVMHYQLHPLFIFVLLGLQYTNIMVIYYTNRIHDQAQEKQAWEIAEHHYAMQQEYYDQLRVQQEETIALWHDISKYLRASQVESSNSALLQVQEMLDGIDCVVDVNNRVVSVILNEYMQALKQAQIKLTMDVQVPKTLFVTAADLYVLIGNTMDNAIEACQSLPADQKMISLKLKTHNNLLYYEISNPFQEAHLRRPRNRYHGYGLKNVARCVEKYSGSMDVSKENGTFKVTAYLNRM